MPCLCLKPTLQVTAVCSPPSLCDVRRVNTDLLPDRAPGLGPRGRGPPLITEAQGKIPAPFTLGSVSSVALPATDEASSDSSVPEAALSPLPHPRVLLVFSQTSQVIITKQHTYAQAYLRAHVCSKAKDYGCIALESHGVQR